MRKLCYFIALSFLWGTALAQSVDTTHKDSAVRIILDGPRPNTSKLLYVINGVIFKDHGKEINPLTEINPDDILRLDVLKGASGQNIYGSRGANGVIMVITKQFAIKTYQKKFVAFSSSYSDYLKTHENKDGDLNYILNGFPLEGNTDEIIRRLYEIPSKDIEGVIFLDKSKNSTLVKSALIINAIKK